MTRHPVDGEPTFGRGAAPAPAAKAPRGRRLGLRLGRLLLSGTALVALWACGPVYIPVPPPGQISFASESLTDAAGAIRMLWITSGGKNGNAADATFFVIDQERAAGVITHARPDGSFTLDPMEGTAGDHVTVYYRDVTGPRQRGRMRAAQRVLPLPIGAHDRDVAPEGAGRADRARLPAVSLVRFRVRRRRVRRRGPEGPDRFGQPRGAS